MGYFDAHIFHQEESFWNISMHIFVSVTTIFFIVDQKALRDKIKRLLQLYVTKRNKEECSSGIGPGHTEHDNILQEIYERKKESEANYHQQSSENAKQINKEKEAASDMRTRSLERLSETRKREAQDSASSCSLMRLFRKMDHT